MKSTILISIIAAQANNSVIGCCNRLPWYLPADLKHFREVTMGKPVVMGRKTWESIGKPLPGRLNLVVSRQPSLRLEGAEVHASLASAIAAGENWAAEHGVEEVFLIGGAEIYGLGLDCADRIYLTKVDLDPEGDAYFPIFDKSAWNLTEAQVFPVMGLFPSHIFETWDRRQVDSGSDQ